MQKVQVFVDTYRIVIGRCRNGRTCPTLNGIAHLPTLCLLLVRSALSYVNHAWPMPFLDSYCCLPPHVACVRVGGVSLCVMAVCGEKPAWICVRHASGHGRRRLASCCSSVLAPYMPSDHVKQCNLVRPGTAKDRHLPATVVAGSDVHRGER